ncbi:MAG: low molecular weight phosphotyrosine protein phosphatase [Alphaproteobacteria bacterium]|nr:low molecular weight phosphotyrosine protein phosphatase [Alphaproteobacteria bacterium]
MEDKSYKVLFVCTGNICRSPTAEGIMANLLKKENLEEKIKIDSAGTHGWHKGEMPDFRSVSCAKGFGVDISKLKSRPVESRDFNEFDLIVAMDEKNMYDLSRLSPHQEETASIHKLLEFASQYGEDVPDPYYRDNFDYVFEMIQNACENLLAHLKSMLDESR